MLSARRIQNTTTNWRHNTGYLDFPVPAAHGSNLSVHRRKLNYSRPSNLILMVKAHLALRMSDLVGCVKHEFEIVP